MCLSFKTMYDISINWATVGCYGAVVGWLEGISQG